jgi:hypothetical protein
LAAVLVFWETLNESFLLFLSRPILLLLVFVGFLPSRHLQPFLRRKNFFLLSSPNFDGTEGGFEDYSLI